MSWAIGLAVLLALGAVAGRLATRLRRRGARLSPRLPRPSRGLIVATLAALFAVAAAVTAHLVFAANPHLVDEMAQLLHARAFAAGRLARPAPDLPAPFLLTHTWVTDAGWVSQYPPGQTALFAVGLLAGVEWLVNPLLGGLTTVFVYLAARGLFGAPTALAAALLWVLSPWVLFTSASYLNHVGAAAFSAAAWAAFWGPGRRRPWHAAAAGLALGLVTITRPLDGIAAGLPLIVWIAVRREWRWVPWIAAGGLPLAAAFCYVNWRLYGGPFTLGYVVLWGEGHGLGFHVDPWGNPYTPAVALSNLAVGLRRLHIHLYEWPIPALLPLAIWGLAARHRRLSNAIVAVGVAAVPLLYFFYWHSGEFLGPRLYYPAAPMLVIATARAWRWAWVRARRARVGLLRWDAALGTVATALVLWGAIGIVPLRWQLYREGLPTMKLHPERTLRDRGVAQALVLVPESWGSRVVATLWDLGIRPGLVERAYRRVDTCTLYQFAREARVAGAGPQQATDALEALLAAALARPDTLPSLRGWPDHTLRLEPGRPIPEECWREMRRDLDGFTTYGNLGWRNPLGLHSGLVFARDLRERNGELFARYRGWEVWRFAPPPDRPDTLPMLRPLGSIDADGRLLSPDPNFPIGVGSEPPEVHAARWKRSSI